MAVGPVFPTQAPVRQARSKRDYLNPSAGLCVNTTRREGTGLGLAITRQFARLMGATSLLPVPNGKGSTFRLEIPVERGDAAVAVRRSAPRRVIGIQAGSESPRVLVVDDQFENRDSLMKLLAVTGFSVQGADNGESAIRSGRN